MRRRRRVAAAENHERWLISYADFITLLFAFFVVMFASGETNRQKAQEVSESVREAFAQQQINSAFSTMLGGKGGSKRKTGEPERVTKPVPPLPAVHMDAPKARGQELSPVLNLLAGELKEEVGRGDLQLSLDSRGLTISLRQAAFYPSGEDTVPERVRPTLAKIAAVVRKVPNLVRVEGHTDNHPIHTPRFRSNWDLSTARAVAILEIFTGDFGIAPGHLAVAGYADTIPMESNDTETGRARNRRVDIVILNEFYAKAEPSLPLVPTTKPAASESPKPSPGGPPQPVAPTPTLPKPSPQPVPAVIKPVAQAAPTSPPKPPPTKKEEPELEKPLPLWPR